MWELSPEEAHKLVNKGYKTLLMRPDLPTREDQYRGVYLIGKDGKYEFSVDAQDYDNYNPQTVELTSW